MRKRLYAATAAVVTLGLAAAGFAAFTLHPQPAKADAGGMPHFQHVFYIMMENQAYDEIIGQSDAPNINKLANEYGLETNYYGVTHPSEPNYVAAVAGSYYTTTNTTGSASNQIDFSGDNGYYCTPTSALPDCAGTTGDHQIDAPSLFSQLEKAGLSWKTYQQSIPSVGFTGLYYPYGVVPGAQDKLYASKHNPIMNFLAYYGPAPTSANFTPNAAQQAELNKMVPDTQLTTDLASGNVPAFSLIVPDQCHDMHGTTSCPSNNALITEGDTYVSQTVSAIQASSTWQKGNNAIVITWDENDYSELDCRNVSIASIGCQVPTIVITNHGPRGVQLNTLSDHYSLLLSVEQAFNLGCLQESCKVQALTPLFRK